MLTSPNVRVRTDRVRITNASHDFSLLWYYGALAGEVEPQATGRDAHASKQCSDRRKMPTQCTIESRRVQDKKPAGP